jgi:hypothetical protein
MSVSHEEVERIATESARKALNEMFVKMGVNVQDPDALLEMQADFKHIRRWRNSTERLHDTSLGAAIIVVTTGILGAIWLALQRGTH